MNAGKYNKKITIFLKKIEKDSSGFEKRECCETEVLICYASVKTTKGILLIKNDTDFEKAYTNFTIRYPRNVEITRDMFIRYNNKEYTIEYLNNVNEENIELEIQAKVVVK